jgi:hypothetical protein
MQWKKAVDAASQLFDDVDETTIKELDVRTLNIPPTKPIRFSFYHKKIGGEALVTIPVGGKTADVTWTRSPKETGMGCRKFQICGLVLASQPGDST